MEPHHLLQHLVPSLERLPAGIQIEYDERSGEHAFTFTLHASGLGLPAKTIFKHCSRFPQQLSLLVSFRASRDSDKEETVLAVGGRDDVTAKFALTLHHGLQLIRIHYTDGVSEDMQTADFRDQSLFDGSWHSMVVVYKSDTVVLFIDCRERHFTRISRTLSATLDIEKHRIYIGNDGRRSRSIFSVSLVFIQSKWTEATMRCKCSTKEAKSQYFSFLFYRVGWNSWFCYPDQTSQT